MILTKHVALGNDFLITINPPRPIHADDARRWCDRHHGIGADGLISLIEQPGAEPAQPGWAMVLRNADGSRAELSGNGLRCVGQALAMAHHLTSGNWPAVITVETDAGPRRLEIQAPLATGGAQPNAIGPLGSDEFPRSMTVRVAMGETHDAPEWPERWVEMGITPLRHRALSVGNPHVVALFDRIDELDMARIGPVVEADYPAGSNVHAVMIIDRTHLTMRIWERGSGMTLACGSGACAAAATAMDWGLVEETVTVTMPGGDAEVERRDGQLWLSGPTHFIAQINSEPDHWARREIPRAEEYANAD